MTEQTNIDHIIDLEMTYENDAVKVRFRVNQEHYPVCFRVIRSPTSNCQMASANAIGDKLRKLNKYQIRNLFIQLRRRRDSKRMLLLDIHKREADHLKESIAKSAIISDSPYTSTNGSNMELMLIRLSSIRQLKLPTITTT
jgi:hypothetical protein